MGSGSEMTLALAVCVLSALVFVLLYRYHRLRNQRDLFLQQKKVVYSFVHDIGEVFAGEEEDELNINQVLKRVLFYALRTTHGGAGAIYLMDSARTALSCDVTSGTFCPLDVSLTDAADESVRLDHVEQHVRKQSIRVGEGLVGKVAASGQSLLIEDGVGDTRVPAHASDFLKIDSVLLVPMRFHQQVLGVMVVQNRVDGRPFSSGDESLLQAVADQASVAVHFAGISGTLDAKRRLDFDLSTAKKIQQALHPRQIPQLDGINLGAFSLPAQEIGGDYYDFIKLDRHHVGIAIADVSGKGVSGALVMAICRTQLRLVAPECLSSAEVLRRVNAYLRADLREDMFISMLYMILNTQTRRLSIARAGHVFPLIYSTDSDEPVEVRSEGIALGMSDPELFNQVLEEKVVQLKSGDLVINYTDGVTDARAEEGDEWGEENVRKMLQQLYIDGSDAMGVCDAIEEKLLQFIGEIPQYDDMTLVAVRVD